MYSILIHEGSKTKISTSRTLLHTASYCVADLLFHFWIATVDHFLLPIWNFSLSFMFLSLPIVRSFLKLFVIYHFLLLLSFNINGCSGGEDLFPVSSHNFIIYTTKHVLSSFILFHGKGEILAALYPATDSLTPLRPASPPLSLFHLPGLTKLLQNMDLNQIIWRNIKQYMVYKSPPCASSS